MNIISLEQWVKDAEISGRMDKKNKKSHKMLKSNQPNISNNSGSCGKKKLSKAEKRKSKICRPSNTGSVKLQPLTKKRTKSPVTVPGYLKGYLERPIERETDESGRYIRHSAKTLKEVCGKRRKQNSR